MYAYFIYLTKKIYIYKYNNKYIFNTKIYKIPSITKIQI